MRPGSFVIVAFAFFALPVFATPSLDARRDRGLDREIALMRRYHLPRFTDETSLRQSIRAGRLVRVPDTGTGFQIAVDFGLCVSGDRSPYKHVLPATLRLILDLGKEFGAKFHEVITLSSLSRTFGYQRCLQRGNVNAVAPEKSSHTSGATFDIDAGLLNDAQLVWMRRRLLELERGGSVLATEERAHPAFHVMVLPSYGVVQHPHFLQRHRKRR